MQIVRKVKGEGIDEYTVAFIDMGNLDLGIDKLEEELLEFQVETYAKLSFNKPKENWDQIFKPINLFLKTLTEEELKVIGRLYYDIGFILKYDFKDVHQLPMLTDKISHMIHNMTSKLGLSKKIFDFIKASDISIPDLKGIGERPQDNEDTTFYTEDYLGLNSIILYCKLFAPVFGQIIFLIKKAVDNSVKESHCVAILKKVLEDDFYRLTEKLLFYILNLTSKGKPVSLTSTYNGYTLNRYSLFIYSAMMIKKFVNVDLYNPGGNIMVYILTCGKGTLDSLNINMGTNNTMMERADPEKLNDAEGNMSRLETESFSSRTTIDVPILVRVGAEQLITRMINTYDLDQDEFDKAVEHYYQNPIPITDISKYLSCTFYGHHLGGAKGIYLLPAKTFVKMIVLMQLYLINIGSYNVVHTLSIVPTGTVKQKFSLVDNQIIMNKGGGFAYQNCKRMFPYAIGNTSWDSKAKGIIDFIVSKIHRFNTAPNLWKLMGQENQNDNQYTYDEVIVRDIFQFIYHILTAIGQSHKENDNIYGIQ